MDRAEEAMAEQTATFIPIAESCNDCVFGAHDLERSYVFNESMSIFEHALTLFIPFSNRKKNLLVSHLTRCFIRR